jgi:hypothetical protein
MAFALVAFTISMAPASNWLLILMDIMCLLLLGTRAA